MKDTFLLMGIFIIFCGLLCFIIGVAMKETAPVLFESEHITDVTESVNFTNGEIIWSQPINKLTYGGFYYSKEYPFEDPAHIRSKK